MTVADRLVSGARVRGRRARRTLTRSSRASASHAVALLKRAPMPPSTRAKLYEVVPWRPGLVEVPITSLLLGTQNRLSGAEFATRSDQLLWPSTRVVDGPHARLLAQDAASDAPLSDDEILASDYGRMARQCIQLSGQFFWAHDDAGILDVARDFLARASGPTSPPEPKRDHQSAPSAPIRLVRVRDSDCFQVIDGHHRIALAAASGATTVRAAVRWSSVTTPLQDLLDKMSWIGGEKELYQPLSSPEIDRAWTIVRRCTDRRDKMLEQVRALGIEPGSASYLDVASCYGWFVKSMSAEGFDARGIERDPLAPVLGEALYGVDPALIETGDAVDLLRRSSERSDVVSCFSLLHHFALGRADVGADELLRLLDGATGRVLFIDTGQAHEAWFERTLPEWTTAYVHQYLRDHSSFDEVIDLGPDRDDVPPYENNYGRHLFACVRTS